MKDLVVEARELLAKATPGPWFDWDNAEWIHEPKHLLSNVEDSTVIARAPELLSALCDEVERLRTALKTIADPPVDLCDHLTLKKIARDAIQKEQ